MQTEIQVAWIPLRLYIGFICSNLILPAESVFWDTDPF